MAVNRAEVVVFDVCDTLYYSNTTYDFIYFFLKYKEDSIRMNSFLMYTNRKGMHFWIELLFGKIFQTDRIKKKVVSLLKGYSKEELYDLAEKFVDFLNAERKIDEVQALLNQYRISNHKIVLCSASIDPVIVVIAKKLKIDYICSQLFYDENGSCTGQLLKDLTGIKLQALKMHIGVGGSPDLIVVSDNKSDRSLFQQAYKSYFVVYSDKDISYWNDLKGEHIKLSKRKYLHE